MARSARSIRAALITDTLSRGIVETIDAAVASVPGLTAPAADVPLRSITLGDLKDAAARPQEPARVAKPTDDEIVEAIRALSGDTDTHVVDDRAYVRATRVAARLGVTTTEIRRRMQSLVKSGRLISVGKAAGKRYFAH